MENKFKDFFPEKLRLSLFKELKQGENIFLRVPQEIPDTILKKFAEILSSNPHVTKGYLAEGFLSANEDVHYIIGVESDIPAVILMEKLLPCFQAIFPKDFYVDFTVLTDRNSEIYQFMDKYLIPFYSKQ